MEQLQTTISEVHLNTKEISHNETPEVLMEATQQLQKFGGFDLLAEVIEGVQNMNPKRRVWKEMFLKEAANKQERDALKTTLQAWAEMLNSSDDVSEMIEACRQKADTAEQLLKKNLKAALDQTKDLERSYRSVALFFKNTEELNVKNVSFINAEPEQLKDLDNPRFIDAIQNELKQNYDRLDLRDNYSLLVIPGYLGSNKVIEKWAKIAYENKVMLVSDFENLDTPDDVMELFERAKLTGPDAYRSNVVITCNWLVGRGKFHEAGEQQELLIPPSTALAGKIYNTLMSQVAAGNKYGSLCEVEGVKFATKKTEIAALDKLGLIPIVSEFGKNMAFSAKTLFDGDSLGLQTYSVVRVFDYIAKVMMHFLNQRAFENFNASSKKELNGKIVRFLDSITGPGKLIEEFSIKKFEQDPAKKDRIYLDIHIKPYFPAKTFLITLDGQKGDDGSKYAIDYKQE